MQSFNNGNNKLYPESYMDMKSTLGAGLWCCWYPPVLVLGRYFRIKIPPVLSYFKTRNKLCVVWSELTSKIAKETPQKHFEDNHCANSSPCIKTFQNLQQKKPNKNLHSWVSLISGSNGKTQSCSSGVSTREI